jgi:peptidoglycan/xylan/chitin deacetylase (PgdA/CDA1 family)
MSQLPEMLMTRLDAATVRQAIFFRDDDAGWEQVALRRLLDLFESHQMPLDLAVIPAAVDNGVAAELRRRADRNDLLGLHQHGFAHVNHEVEGRKCEFGAARHRQQQQADIERGRAALHKLFGLRLDAIFTPPWNRCSADTRAVLRELGFSAISQTVEDAGAADDALAELPITFDWQKPRTPRRTLPMDAPIGVMLHHAVMSETDFAQLDRLLAVLARHGAALPRRMRDLVVQPC